MTRYLITTDAQVKAALAKAIAGDVLDFNGTFAPIKIAKPGLYLDGRDAHIQGTAASTYGLLVYKADDVTVQGFEVSHVGKGSGIVAYESDDVFVFHTHEHHNTGHGIALNHSGGGRAFNNVVEHNASGSSRYNAYSGISDFANDGDDNAIRSNVVRYNVNETGPTDGLGIIKDGGSGGVAVDYNRVYGNGHAGIGAVNSPGGFSAMGNIVYGNGTDPTRVGKITGEIYLRNVHGAEFENNKITASAAHYAAVVVNSSVDWDDNIMVGKTYDNAVQHNELNW